MIPNDALGILSNGNTAPLYFRNTTQRSLLFEITEKSDDTLVLTAMEQSTAGGAVYLGCVVSSDRQTIYWVNETRPLP